MKRMKVMIRTRQVTSVYLACLSVLLLLWASHADASGRAPRPDPSFGSRGVMTIDFGVGRDAAYAVASSLEGDGGLRSRDGRYYLAGPVASSPPNGTDFGLACLEARDGSPCSGFGTNGRVRVDFDNTRPNASRTDVATAIAVQPFDGKIVVLGESNFGTTGPGNENLTFSLSRHNPDGSLDVPYFGNDFSTGAFNGQGKATFKLDLRGVNDEIFAGLVLPDGRIAATGFSNPGNTSGTGPSATFNFGTAVFDSDGIPDREWGGFEGERPGASITDIGPGWDDRPRGIARNPVEGSFLLSGRTRPPSLPLGTFRGAVAKLRARGDVDTSFGRDAGVIPGTLVGQGVALYHPPGRNGSTLLNDIVLLGLSKGSRCEASCDERDREAFSSSTERSWDRHPARDPPFLVAGTTTAWDDGISGDAAFLVARVLPDGRVDRDWGDQGYAVLKYPSPGTTEAFKLLIDDRSDRIYLLGRVVISGSNAAAVASFSLEDGSPDRSFGQDGVAILDIGGGTGFLRGGLLDDAGKKLLAVGERTAPGATSADFLAVRLILRGR